MSHAEAAPNFRLPERLPIFPLSGALLLPRARLPLNIFEPRYLAMVRDAMRDHRLIGMVQPTEPEELTPVPKLYRVGCAGRIGEFEETEDGRFLITLTGIMRFDIIQELQVETAYRQVSPDWDGYKQDLLPPPDSPVDRARLDQALLGYLKLHQIPIDTGALRKLPDSVLVDAAAMLCPFATNEKQALLEAPDVPERGRVLVALLEMALLQRAGGWEEDDVRH